MPLRQGNAAGDEPPQQLLDPAHGSENSDRIHRQEVETALAQSGVSIKGDRRATSHNHRAFLRRHEDRNAASCGVPDYVELANLMAPLAPIQARW